MCQILDVSRVADDQHVVMLVWLAGNGYVVAWLLVMNKPQYEMYCQKDKQCATCHVAKNNALNFYLKDSEH